MASPDINVGARVFIHGDGGHRIAQAGLQRVVKVTGGVATLEPAYKKDIVRKGDETPRLKQPVENLWIAKSNVRL